MTFKEIWNQLCKKSPKLENGKSSVEMDADNLKTLLEQVYDKGFEAGKKVNPPASSSSLFGSNGPFGFGG